MKTSILFIAACICSVRGFAQVPNQNESGKFCANIKDGLMVLTQNEVVVTNDIVLRDSSKITKDAVIVKKDGSKMELKEGECVDIDGNILVSAEGRPSRKSQK